MSAEEGVGTVFGDVVFEHRGDDPIVVETVDLVNSDGLVLRESYLVGLASGESVVGIGHQTDMSQLPTTWDERREADGATVYPGEEWNLVVIVEPSTTDSGAADAISVEYSANGETFRKETLTSLVLAETCHDPS